MAADLQRWGRPERLVFLPVLGALIGVWVASVTLTMDERRNTLERAATQLQTTIVTLADFNALAEETTGERAITASDQRTAAIWRALLQYPSASVWLESNGEVTGGQPPADPSVPALRVREDRGTFSVFAALPERDALTEWVKAARERAVIVILASIAFLLLTRFLARALQQRAVADQQRVAAQARADQLAVHKADLEHTVELRTGELREANGRLENELTERRTAEAQLREHDALLHAVAKSAAELLGSPSHEHAITAVLELIGKTLSVSRVHLSEIATDRDGHLRSSIRFEWCAPGMTPVINLPALQNVDLTTALPRSVALLPVGGSSSFHVEEVGAAFRKSFEDADMRSFLQLPVRVEGKLWGSFDFVDSSLQPREWSWAETDTLQTLAGLIGAAITRARYVKELADANMIVQNSPTILYRVRGEPPFPLIYVSHNIAKLGHRPEELVGSSNWAARLMSSDDEDKIVAAMLRSLERDAQGASIECRVRNVDGVQRWVENRYTPVRDKQGRLVEIEGMIIDITERKAAEEKIATLARTDGLTGLANRTTFIERMRQAFSASRRGASAFSILYLDLDHFKGINDTLGHPIGDLLLREVAHRLRGCTRETDVVARLGGDEFAVLQAEMAEIASAGKLAATIQAALSRPYRIDGNDLHVTVSIGISPYVDNSPSPDAMLAQADLALYRSKEEGRNRYRFHSDDLDHQVLERVTLAEELRQAMHSEQLEVYYQPQVEIVSGRIVAMEALARWHHPTRGLLPAGAFIDVAEKTGTIIPLGQWVLEQACKQMRAWRDEGMLLGGVTMNLSLTQLKNRRELLRDVAGALERWRLAPQDLSFDVTEATLAQLTLLHNDALNELRRLGVGIAIDDFGSEYSSLDYLRRYRVSHLKITQEFMGAAAGDPERAATMRAILKLAGELGIGVVTEGVETQAQRDRSSETAAFAQGHYFGAALANDEATDLLRRVNESDGPPDARSDSSPTGTRAAVPGKEPDPATPALAPKRAVQ